MVSRAGDSQALLRGCTQTAMREEGSLHEPPLQLLLPTERTARTSAENVTEG